MYGLLFLQLSIFPWCFRPRTFFWQTDWISFHGPPLYPLHRRHKDHDGVSNHQPQGCLLNWLFGRRSTKTPKLLVTGLCAGNSPGPGNSLRKGPVTRKRFPFDDVIMSYLHTILRISSRSVSGWFSLRCLGQSMNHLPPVWWSNFRFMFINESWCVSLT